MFHGRINKRIIIRISAVVFWLAVWQAASTFTGLEFILAGPVKVLFCLLDMLKDKEVYIILAHSFLRIFSGFAAAFVTALLSGFAAFANKTLKDLINIPVIVMKSLPIAAFIILVLMVAGSSRISSIISFIVTFPVVYYGIMEGLENTDKNLNDMARVFKTGVIKKFRFILIPQCMPYIKAAVKTSAGMCWKAGTAAEIIGLPGFSIGEQMYLSKLYLQSDVLLSWGVLVIAAGVFFEKAFLWLIQRAAKELSKIHYRKEREGSFTYADRSHESTACAVNINNVSKSYNGEKVLDNISLDIRPGGHVCLMGRSGIGKTTLIRIILGLERSDDGEVLSSGSCSAVFQESSLCPWMSAVDNVYMVLKDKRYSYTDVRNILKELINAEALDKPAEYLSGGMKRRCEIVRAVLYDSSAVVLDEPFAGLDGSTKLSAAGFIMNNINKRTLIVSTHDPEDVKQLSAAAFVIDKNDNDC